MVSSIEAFSQEIIFFFLLFIFIRILSHYDGTIATFANRDYDFVKSCRMLGLSLFDDFFAGFTDNSFKCRIIKYFNGYSEVGASLLSGFFRFILLLNIQKKI
jgi:hypothetical protein